MRWPRMSPARRRADRHGSALIELGSVLTELGSVLTELGSVPTGTAPAARDDLA